MNEICTKNLHTVIVCIYFKVNSIRLFICYLSLLSQYTVDVARTGFNGHVPYLILRPCIEIQDHYTMENEVLQFLPSLTDLRPWHDQHIFLCLLNFDILYYLPIHQLFLTNSLCTRQRAPLTCLFAHACLSIDDHYTMQIEVL